ncbi:hypothetical protein ABID62_007360 [Bradyrhizobium sp. S3.9.1]
MTTYPQKISFGELRVFSVRWGIRHHRNPLSSPGTLTVRQQLCS